MNGDFYGLSTAFLENEYLRLEYLAKAGPRLVRLFLAGSAENLLAEAPDLHWDTPYGRYYVRGGHRLWHAPEAPRSYVPDNEGLLVEDLADGVHLYQPTETATGIQKSLGIHLHPDRAAITLDHYLQNNGPWPVKLAPWAITQVRLGGVALLPQQAGPLDGNDRLPNRHLVLWPYTHWHDPRLHWHDDYVLVEGRAQDEPCKIGYLNCQGWLGYLWRDVLFCKRFTPRPDRCHADWGCNTEIYANDRLLELETLAPLVRLEPGESTTHTEVWEFYTGFEPPSSLAEARSVVTGLLERAAA